MEYLDNLKLPKEKYAIALSKWFQKNTGKYLNLRNPRTFNEKIQWLKLYDSTALKTITTDKYLVRDWVKERIGEKYLVKLLGVYDSFDEIDFSVLPNRFAMKTTHGSGWNYVVKDKSKIKIEELRKKFNKWLNLNFAYMFGFELHYANIKPRIIIEEYIENKDGKLYDYKFWCFNGKPMYIQFRDDWTHELKMAFFDTDWNKQCFAYDHEIYDKILERPSNLDEMLDIAQKLCQNFYFVCVDLYRLDDGRIYFGEMTYTRSSGIANWRPAEINHYLGDLIKLPENKEAIMASYNYEMHDDKPKVSIIMPVYDVEKYLEKSLNSLINQTLTDIEIICIDDESPDKCGEILDFYSSIDSRIKVIHQKNSGQASARNRGLEIARGKYIQFLDSDDTYAPTCCEKMYSVMENCDADFACYGTNVIYEVHEDHKNYDESYMNLKYKGIQKAIPAMARTIDVHCWSKIFKTSFIHDNNISFPEKLHYEDVVFFWSCLIHAKKIYFYNEKLINYVRREGSFTDEIFNKKSSHVFDMIEAWKQIAYTLITKDAINDFLPYFCRMIINNFHWGMNSFASNDIASKKLFMEKYYDIVKMIINYPIPKEHQEQLNNIIEQKKAIYKLYNNFEYEEVAPIGKNAIPIIFACDQNYVEVLSVAIQSLVDNSNDSNLYDIIILYSGLYEYSKKFLYSIVKNKHNISLRFFNMEKFIKSYSLNKLMTINHISHSAYYRLFAGKIFHQYKKIIYLDCDIVICNDIAALYNHDMGDYPIAACNDLIISNQVIVAGFNQATWNAFNQYMSNTLNFYDTRNYFNSGVLLIDIEKFNNFGFENLLDLAKKNTKFFHDQNVLNAAFQSNYCKLDSSWNFQWHLQFMVKDFQKFIADDDALMFLDCKFTPNIIHYTSQEKPWKNMHHAYANEWWKYARRSPFYEIITEKRVHNIVASRATSPATTLSNPQKSPPRIATKLRYLRYKILAEITWGKTRKKYKEKRKVLKAIVRSGK